MDKFEKNISNVEDINDFEIFKKISECSPNGIIVTDKKFNIRFFNGNAEKLTKISIRNATNKYFYSIFPNMPQVNEKNDFEKNLNIILVNGKNLHVKVFSIMHDENIEYIVFMLQDISEEIILTIELEKSKHIAKELEDILEGSFDGVLVTDGEGNAIFVNKSYERVTGISKEELMGRNMKELINPIWMKNSVVFPVIESKKSISLHHTTRYGKNIIVTGTPVFDQNGEVNKIVVNARDISEIYELREELQKAREMENIYFNNVLDSDYTIQNQGIVVASEPMKALYSLAHKVSAFDATILILGESGVGKDVVAKYIHENSIRKEKPFMVINCGAIPENLLESELFGYERGAFTGASKDGKMGLFEAAEGGVLFLDEIGEMSSNLQVKLLRVLESRMISRVGSLKPILVDVRIIAATNKDLESRIKTGEFREDLFYRLNVIQIKIPPLRERIKDIAPLSLYFLQMFNNKYGQGKKLTYDVIEMFESYNWTGNIRQLKNTVENMVVVSNNEFLQINDVPWYSKSEFENKIDEKIPGNDIISLEESIEIVEKQLLIKAMEKYKSTRKIGLAIGIDQSTVVRKLKKYGLS